MLFIVGLSWLLWSLNNRPPAPLEDPPHNLSRHPALRIQRNSDESDAFFAGPEIRQITLELDESEAEKLRSDARVYVKCKLKDDAMEAMQVGLKLKGAAGSFRELDDRPAFTINVNKYRKQQRYYMLEKFYLNNSVQDESYYSEWLCAWICRQLHLPAPRITFAHVHLGDRDLGLYVLKEGFDEAFIARHFKESDGSLYDGGFVQDVDVDLEKDLGSPKDDLSDLVRLRAACLEPDMEVQRTAIEQTLDIDAFLTFMAFEMMACHWDGYVANKNNYRIYFPKSSGAWFLPHGMDQMFQDVEFSLFEPREPLATRAVRGQSDWNDRYRARVRELLPEFEPVKLIGLIEQLEERLRPELLKLDPNCGPARDEQLVQWRERLTRRYASMLEQLEQPDPPLPVPEPSTEEPVVLEVGQSLVLSDWYPRQETPAAGLTSTEEENVIYRIEAGEATDCIASWRRAIMLTPGQYRLTVELRGEGIQPRAPDDRGIGAGVRISGASRDQGFTNTFDWQIASYDFTIERPAQAAESDGSVDETVMFPVELVTELRAAAGWCEMRLPTLTRVEPK